MKISLGLLLLAAATSLAGCSGGADAPPPPDERAPPPVIDDSPTRGTLVQTPPPRLHSMDQAGVGAAIARFGGFGSQVLALAGNPACGIDVHKIEYATVGAAGEPTRASAALMVPTGAAAACSGKHPMLMYGHGSSLIRQVDMTALRPGAAYATSGIFVAAMFAAQGYIVLAPNYAGYDSSTLSYHPHHIADQNAKDMLDALTAARKALRHLRTPVAENGKLFLAGHSEGGYVTMATARAMQALGMQVAAAVPMSGNYAASVVMERTLSRPEMFSASGRPMDPDNILKYAMRLTAWHKAQGNLYASPSELYAAAYVPGIEALAPNTKSATQLVASGKLPRFLMGNDMPHVAALAPAQQAWYGPPELSLLKSSYMAPLLADVAAIPCPATSSINPLDCATTHPGRRAWFNNDLRTWTPTSPMLMCSGHADQEVDHANTVLTYAYFQAHGLAPGLVSVLDIDSPAGAGDPHAPAKAAFIGARQFLASVGEDPDSEENYHGLTSFAGCMVAARDFFARH